MNYLDNKVPKTADQVREKFRQMYDDPGIVACMIGIFQCNIGMGQPLLEAYENALKAYINAGENGRNSIATEKKNT